MRVYSAHTERKVHMFMSAFAIANDVFGWEYARVWWSAANATLLRESWDDGYEL